MTDELYGVKLIFKYYIQGENPQTLYEERILSVYAISFDEAYEKAEKYAEAYCRQYENINGDRVTVSFYKAVDCFLCEDAENDVREIYSGFMKAEDNFCSDPCEASELRILRQK